MVFAVFSMGVLALRRGPFGRVLVGMKDSEAACATLGLSLRTTKLVVFMLSAAMAGVAGALFGAAELGGRGHRLRDVREPAHPGRRGHRRRLGLLAGALAGGLALGFLPGNAEDVFIGAGTIILAFYSDGVLPADLLPLQPLVERAGGAAARAPVPRRPDERAGTLAGTRAA